MSAASPAPKRARSPVMVSGPRDEIEHVRGALEVFGKVFVCGERPGMAQSMKLANNFLSATGMAASSEAIAMGVKAGLDPSLMCDVINAGSGMNTATTQKFPRSVLPGTFDYGFGMALMVKDVRLFLAEAEDYGIPVEVAKAVGNLWKRRWPSMASGRISPSSPRRSRSAPRADAREKEVGGAKGADHERRHLGIYAVRYAEHQRKAAENYIGGDPHDVLQPLDYFVWVIKSDKRTFLVDTGFDQPVGTKRGRTVVTPIDEGLNGSASSRQDRRHHHQPHHYDHCGNVGMFPARPLPPAGQGDAFLHRALHVP